MRPCSAALAAYLAANDGVVIADLYTFALTSGEVLRYSGGDTALSIPGAGFPTGSLNTRRRHKLSRSGRVSAARR